MSQRDIFRSRTFKFLTAVLLFFVCLGINIHIRLFPAYFPQLKERAAANIRKQLWEKETEKVNKLYPDYNVFAREALVKELVKNDLSDKGSAGKMVSDEYSSLISGYRNSSGQTYLLEFDPYQWLRYTENILRNGHCADRISNGESRDTYMLAPVGTKVVPWPFLMYLSAFIYKVLHFFFPSSSLYQVIFYLPVFYAAVFLSVVFWLSCWFFKSPFGAFISASFIGFSPFVVQRSCAGWYDYDMLNMTFPLLVVLFTVLALRRSAGTGRALFYAFCAALCQFSFSFSWGGWWFILVIILSAVGYLTLNNFFIYQRDLKEAMLQNRRYFLFLSFFLSAVFLLFLLGNPQWFSLLGYTVGQYLHLGSPAYQSVWPNTYFSVGEVRSASISEIASYLYGMPFFFIVLLSMLAVYWKNRRTLKQEFVLIMFFWFFFILLASLKSVRFVILLVVPLGFFVGGVIPEFFPGLFQRMFVLRRWRYAVASLFFASVVLAFFSWMSLGVATAKSMAPVFNSDWERVLTRISLQTPDDSVINSWWDYGVWFKAVGKRRVIFDGHTQTTGGLAYWMGKALLSDDEKESLSILRVLNNSSTLCYDELVKYIKDEFKAAVILNKLFGLDRAEAERLLRAENVPDEGIKRITGYLFSVPAPAYFLVDESLLPKAGSISFLADWDFMKFYLKQNMAKDRRSLVSAAAGIFGVSPEKADQSYSELLLTPRGRASDESLSQRRFVYAMPEEGDLNGGSVCFNNGLVFDLAAKKAVIYSPRGKYSRIKKVIFFEGGDFKEFDNPDGDDDTGVLITKRGDKYESVIADSELLRSLLIRLYFLRGDGLKHFQPFIMDDKAKIYVYKINWGAADE